MGLHYLMINDTTARKQTRFKTINELITNALLLLRRALTICTRADDDTDNNNRAINSRIEHTNIILYNGYHKVLSSLINHSAQKHYHNSMLNNYQNKQSDKNRAEKNNRAETSLVKLTDLKKEELIFHFEDITNFITQSYRAKNTKQYCNVITFSSKESS